MEERNAERPTDVELMEAVVRRDSDAMAAIYQRYESTLGAVILSVLHEEDETDDVLHLSELLSRMIRLLLEPQQEVVQLTFFKGMSQREIAAQKSIALGTVKT
jgi:DNA-directed RNA polymerase specialized sigma subunit